MVSPFMYYYRFFLYAKLLNGIVVDVLTWIEQFSEGPNTPISPGFKNTLNTTIVYWLVHFIYPKVITLFVCSVRIYGNPSSGYQIM